VDVKRGQKEEAIAPGAGREKKKRKKRVLQGGKALRGRSPSHKGKGAAVSGLDWKCERVDQTKGQSEIPSVDRKKRKVLRKKAYLSIGRRARIAGREAFNQAVDCEQKKAGIGMFLRRRETGNS